MIRTVETVPKNEDGPNELWSAHYEIGRRTGPIRGTTPEKDVPCGALKFGAGLNGSAARPPTDRRCRRLAAGREAIRDRPATRLGTAKNTRLGEGQSVAGYRRDRAGFDTLARKT